MNAPQQCTSKTVNTTCAYCGVGCGIRAEVALSATNSVQVKGDKQHFANQGRLCSKGTALGETLGLKERLLHPEINGKRVSWDAALNTIAQRFTQIKAEHGADALAFYLSGQLLTEDYYVANKLMKGFIGSANVDTNSRLCMSSSVAGHKRAFGTDTVPGCYEDFEQAELITLVGSNTAWCHPVLFQRIKQYKKQNPKLKVVVVDPRETQTCEIADLHLPLKLGTDTYLFNGLLNYLNENKLLNSDYISQHCEGFDEALAAAQQSTGELKKLAAALGIDADLLTQFYTLFGATERSVTLYSQGVNQSSSGTDKVNTILNCHLATGRIGKPGMGPFSMTGQPNAMGGREVGGLANTLAAHMDFSEQDQALVQKFWDSPSIASAPGRMAIDMFEAIDRGEIKAVWIMATNPVVSIPNADLVKRALEKCELVIVSDCIADTDTARLASIKLPATGWGEKDGTVTNSERCISRQRALMPKSGEAQHDWWALAQVGKRMGWAEHFDYHHQADVFREHAALSGYKNAEGEDMRRRDFDISALAKLTNEQYEALSPCYWPLPSQGKVDPAVIDDGKHKRFFANGKFYTPSRKAHMLAITPRAPVNSTTEAYPLKLNTGRVRDQWHTMTRTGLAAKLNQHINEPYLQMHPHQAEKLGLTHGTLVRAQSEWGEMIARLQVTLDVRKDEVFAPMHWGDALSKQARVNASVNPAVDPVSRQPESKHTPVKVSAFAGKHFGLAMYAQGKADAALKQAQAHIWQQADYALSTLGAAQQCLSFASESKQNANEAWLNRLLGFKPSQDLSALPEGLSLIRYDDEARGDYRAALIDSTGALQVLVLISKREINADQTWLAMQFEQASLSERSRRALLSGHAPAGEDIGKIVCACFSVGEKSIQKAISEGCCSTEAIGNVLKAGTNCGSCLPEIEGMF